MDSQFCKDMLKCVRQVLNQGRSAVRVAKAMALPGLNRYIQRLEGTINLTNKVLELYCTVGKKCTDERKCIWLVGHHGYKLTFDVDTLVLHISKKQFQYNVDND